MITSAELKNELANCYCTEDYHYGSGFKQFYYTDGVKIMAEKAKAYWLLDAIGSHLATNGANIDRACDGFQLWTLTRNKEGKGVVLTCQKDSGTKNIVEQVIEYSDFPLENGESISFYIEGMGKPKSATVEGGERVLLLPSEH